MKLINAFQLYKLAAKLRRIEDTIYVNTLRSDSRGTRYNEARRIAGDAALALSQLIESDTLDLRLSRPAIDDLQREIYELYKVCTERSQNDEKDQDEFVQFHEITAAKEALQKFENILNAELSQSALFTTSQKAAYDTNILVTAGYRAFPGDLLEKCPDQELDARQAMRCIAFDLPTAAAFHLHRLNEGVLGKYWDAKTGNSKRPKGLGQYIDRLEKEKDIDEHLLISLRDIKNLHRNPVVHPEQIIDSAEEVISLHGIIYAAIAAMLKHIPVKTKLEESHNILASILSSEKLEDQS